MKSHKYCVTVEKTKGINGLIKLLFVAKRFWQLCSCRICWTQLNLEYSNGWRAMRLTEASYRCFVTKYTISHWTDKPADAFNTKFFLTTLLYVCILCWYELKYTSLSSLNWLYEFHLWKNSCILSLSVWQSVINFGLCSFTSYNEA